MKWKRDVRMLSEEVVDVLGLVRGEIVEHHMNLLGPSGTRHQAFEESDELLAGVPSRRHALHLTGLHVESCVQRQRAVAIVLKAVPFGAPRR